jgi:hypothetical protein
MPATQWHWWLCFVVVVVALLLLLTQGCSLWP